MSPPMSRYGGRAGGVSISDMKQMVKNRDQGIVGLVKNRL